MTSIQSVFSEFRISIEQRKSLAKELSQVASQRTVAKALGVSASTINSDVQNRTPSPENTQETLRQEDDDVQNRTQAWFQDDADPSKLAKSRERQAKKRRRSLRRMVSRREREILTLVYRNLFSRLLARLRAFRA